MSNEGLCFGCKHLVSKGDAAGGGTYYCYRGVEKPKSYDQIGGAVIGEYGHWTDPEIDDPKRCQHFEAVGR